MNTTSSFLTVADIIADLQIGKTTWYRWLKNEDIPTPEPISGIGRMRRYSRDDYLAFKETLGGTIGGIDQAA